MAKNLPVNAGDMGSIPTPERFHMPQGSLASVLKILSLHATTTEANMLWSPCSLTRGATRMRSLHTITRE